MKGASGRDIPSVLDGRLVRLLDGEVSAEERAELLEMLEASPEARARYDELQSVSSRLSDLLDRASVPPVPDLALPERRAAGSGSGGVFWLRLAAGVVLLLAVGLTVQPVRAWLTTGVQRVVELLVPQDAGPAAADVAVPEQGTESPSTVSFLPVGPVFVVAVRAAQGGGVLTVERALDSGEVTASVLDGAGETLVILPSGLGISNTPESTASYRVAVPSTLSTVEVRVADVAVATLTPGEGPGRWEIPLARR